MLIKHSLVEDKQLGYLTELTLHSITNIKVKMITPNSIKLQKVPFSLMPVLALQISTQGEQKINR